MATPTRPSPQPVSQMSAARRKLLRSFDDYLDAQRLVDRMSDGGFPVDHVSILRTIECVVRVAHRLGRDPERSDD